MKASQQPIDPDHLLLIVATVAAGQKLGEYLLATGYGSHLSQPYGIAGVA
jgi:hypothetical protein